MVAGKLGTILVIAGFVLLMLNKAGRRRGRGVPVKGEKGGTGLLSWWLRWGDYIALGMLAAGLVGMLVQK